MMERQKVARAEEIARSGAACTGMYIEFSQLGPRDLISSAKKMIRGPMSEDR
jgi:hypothetical protein